MNMSSYIPYPGVDAPTPDIYSRVLIAGLNRPARSTDECPIGQGHLLDRAAVRAGLCTWPKAINLDDFFTRSLLGHTVEDRHELGETQVANLPAPQPFHAVDVQVLEAQHVVFVQQFPGQLEMTVAALIGQSDMSKAQLTFGLPPIAAPFALAGQATIQPGDLGHVRAEELRRLILPALVVSQERFETEVKPADLIRAGFDNLNVLNDGEANKQSPGSVALNRDRLNLAINRAGQGELVVSPADLNPVITVVFPASLLKCEAGIQLDFFESRPASLASSLSGHVLKETLVGRVVSFDNALYRLAAEQLPLGASSVPQAGDVLHHAVLVDVAAINPVVAPLQSRDVVPDDPGHIHLLDECAVSPVIVEAILERLTDLHGLLVFLILDIAPDNIFGNMPNALAVVAARPECRQTTFQMRERLPQPPRCYTFQLLDNVVRRERWRSFHEQMDMIWHDFDTGDCYTNLVGLFVEQAPQLYFHRANQYLSSVLRTPYQVIANVVDRLVARRPSGITHKFYYTSDSLIVQIKSAIHPTSKLAGFLAGRS